MVFIREVIRFTSDRIVLLFRYRHHWDRNGCPLLWMMRMLMTAYMTMSYQRPEYSYPYYSLITNYLRSIRYISKPKKAHNTPSFTQHSWRFYLFMVFSATGVKHVFDTDNIISLMQYRLKKFNFGCCSTIFDLNFELSYIGRTQLE